MHAPLPHRKIGPPPPCPDCNGTGKKPKSHPNNFPNRDNPMSSEIAEDIYVVVATKDGTVEYWAVVLPFEEILDAMAQATGPGWQYSVTTEWLTVQRAAELGVPINPVRRIGPKL
jgi:hypothetical protein